MKFTIEDKLKIIELREQGMGYSAIAKQFDVQYSTIRRMLSRYNQCLLMFGYNYYFILS